MVIGAIQQSERNFTPEMTNLRYGLEQVALYSMQVSRRRKEKKANFYNWVEGKKKFMVCSSSMSGSIDVKGVTEIFHSETPWSLYMDN